MVSSWDILISRITVSFTLVKTKVPFEFLQRRFEIRIELSPEESTNFIWAISNMMFLIPSAFSKIISDFSRGATWEFSLFSSNVNTLYFSCLSIPNFIGILIV
jgi:hypothetical protein